MNSGTVDRLQELHEGSTPSPWQVGIGGDAVYANDHMPSWVVADVRDGADTGLSDADLIAAMRNSLPALLSVAEAAQGLMDAVAVVGHPAVFQLRSALAALNEQP